MKRKAVELTALQ